MRRRGHLVGRAGGPTHAVAPTHGVALLGAVRTPEVALLGPDGRTARSSVLSCGVAVNWNCFWLNIIRYISRSKALSDPGRTQ